MKKLFNANTMLSFGLGSAHYAVYRKGKYGYIETGTPMNPVMLLRFLITEKIEKEIMECDGNMENAGYIEYIILRHTEMYAFS